MQSRQWFRIRAVESLRESCWIGRPLRCWLRYRYRRHIRDTSCRYKQRTASGDTPGGSVGGCRPGPGTCRPECSAHWVCPRRSYSQRNHWVGNSDLEMSPRKGSEFDWLNHKFTISYSLKEGFCANKSSIFRIFKKPSNFFFKCEKQQCNVADVTKNIDQINKTIAHVPKKPRLLTMY